MIVIKPLPELVFESAMLLRINCWTEELNEKGENRLELAQEVADLTDWLSNADKYNDYRVIVGAYEDNQLLGFAAASFAELFDIESNGFELNYLFVDENSRGRGISLKLLEHLADLFSQKDCTALIVYSHHFAPSNAYFHKLGGIVIKQEEQGRDRLLVDVFKFEVKNLEVMLRGFGTTLQQ